MSMSAMKSEKLLAVCCLSRKGCLIAAEILVKHDYRNIKISETQTITVDLEEMKKDLERRIYKALGYPGF